MTDPIPDQTDEELNAVAYGLATGHIFCDRHCRSVEDLPLVFMVLVFMRDPIPENVGLIYEYLDKAELRGVNGYPNFLSARWLNRHDTELVLAKYEKLKVVMKEALKPEQNQ